MDPKEKRRLYQQEYYRQNRERLLEKQRARGKENYKAKPDAYRARAKAWREKNSERMTALQKDYRDRNREKLKARSRAHYLANKPKNLMQSRRSKLKRYGLTEAQYREMLAAQDHACAICATSLDRVRTKHLYVDHCHKTLKVRGLLCQKCNSGLGMFRDDPKIIERAMLYLNR